MTLADALRALHEAGQIRSPWLPGMLATGEGWLDVARVIDIGHDGLPDAWEYRGYLRGRDESGHKWAEYDPAPPPVVTDPATRGCLLALLREAAGDPNAHVDPSVRRGRICWVAWVCGRNYERPTEGDALEAALVALADEVTRG